jgi:hypothetical protein
LSLQRPAARRPPRSASPHLLRCTLVLLCRCRGGLHLPARCGTRLCMRLRCPSPPPRVWPGAPRPSSLAAARLPQRAAARLCCSSRPAWPTAFPICRPLLLRFLAGSASAAAPPPAHLALDGPAARLCSLQLHAVRTAQRVSAFASLHARPPVPLHRRGLQSPLAVCALVSACAFAARLRRLASARRTAPARSRGCSSAAAASICRPLLLRCLAASAAAPHQRTSVPPLRLPRRLVQLVHRRWPQPTQ